ncbi:hypothetical protein A9Q83_05750 [Alphaproteobacteria bacterium 46_93_T64]|nr:hypothetical protein A9Q83_05750 [Alphaproteobacteria bacterium 46_93_T64]
MANIKLDAIQKSYGTIEVIHGVDIDIKDGEFCVFVGPSGCGKSTLLRMIAGLEEITSGEMKIGGNRVNELPPADRGIAMVFQSYALYPHMSVYKNMAFGLSIKKFSKTDVKKRVHEAAEILQLTDLLTRKPAQLSGGQRQRVAIGRAIVRDPEVFLFDEPLSNLDAALRVQTRIEIAKLHTKLKNTVIYVTHDQVEAMTLADKIVVLNDGRVEQIGSPLDLYDKPQNLFVAGFIGSPKMNFLKASQTEFSSASVETIGVRPEHLRQTTEADLLLTGTADVVERLGDVSYVYLTTTDGTNIIIATPGASKVEPGDTVTFGADKQSLHFFNADGIRCEGD